MTCWYCISMIMLAFVMLLALFGGTVLLMAW